MFPGILAIKYTCTYKCVHIYSLFFKRENTPYLVPSLSFSYYRLAPDVIPDGQGQENQGELLQWLEVK